MTWRAPGESRRCRDGHRVLGMSRAGSTRLWGHPRVVMTWGAALALAASLVSCASGEWEPPQGLPAEWVEDGGSDDRADWIIVRLEPDGTAILQNVPVWDGRGSCGASRPESYSGRAQWSFAKGGFTLDNSDIAPVELMHTGRLGRDVWEKVGLAVCGRDSTQGRILFLSGGGPNGEFGDPRDRAG